jgi:ubiquinone/menaquinone biosynthesis C-methylase UbiE
MTQLGTSQLSLAILLNLELKVDPMAAKIDEPIVGSPAEIYDKYNVPALFGPWSEDFVAFVAPTSGQSILDVACGTGALTKLLADKAGVSSRIVGLDFDDAMLSIARSHRPEIEWREANAMDMPFQNAEFDIITSHQGFQFIPDKQTGLREIHRVLTPNGQVKLSIWRSIEYIPGYHAISKALAKWVNPDAAKLGAFALGDPDSLRLLVSTAGFRDIEIHPVSKHVHFASAKRFVELAIAGSSALTRQALAEVSATDMISFKNDIVEMLMQYETSTSLALPSESHYLTAVKS